LAVNICHSLSPEKSVFPVALPSNRAIFAGHVSAPETINQYGAIDAENPSPVVRHAALGCGGAGSDTPK